MAHQITVTWYSLFSHNNWILGSTIHVRGMSNNITVLREYLIIFQYYSVKI